MYNDKILIRKQEVITPITDYTTPVNSYQNNDNMINFTTDDIRSNLEAFQRMKRMHYI